jgi:hypothetical protein
MKSSMLELELSIHSLRFRAADLRLQKIYNFSMPPFLSHPPSTPCIAELQPGSDDAGQSPPQLPRYQVITKFSNTAAMLVQQSLPFVIRGGVRDWPACAKWT